eukprot:m.44576 g.44576  ORF g.44576 m.44576 type:complete len:511 (+) comp13028_c0_seq1:216-1748(+)
MKTAIVVDVTPTAMAEEQAESCGTSPIPSDNVVGDGVTGTDTDESQPSRHPSPFTAPSSKPTATHVDALTISAQPMAKQVKRTMLPTMAGQAAASGALWNIPPAFLQRGLATQMHSNTNPAMFNPSMSWSQPSSQYTTQSLGQVMPPSFSHVHATPELGPSLQPTGDGVLPAMWGYGASYQGHSTPAPPDLASALYQQRQQQQQAALAGLYQPRPPVLNGLHPPLGGGSSPAQSFSTDMLLQQQQMLLQQRQQQLAQQQQQLSMLMQGRNPAYPRVSQSALNPGPPMGSDPAFNSIGMAPSHLPHPSSSLPANINPNPQSNPNLESQYLPAPAVSSIPRKKVKLPAKRLTPAERNKVVAGIKARLTCDIDRLMSCIQRLKQLQLGSQTAEQVAVYRDKLMQETESQGLCRQCNRQRNLHSKWPLCLACLKHNTAHTKQFKQRYAVEPKLDLELFVFVTMARLLANSRHQCHCTTGPDHACTCVFDERTLTCIPCRFLRGVEWVIRVDLWT